MEHWQDKLIGSSRPFAKWARAPLGLLVVLSACSWSCSQDPDSEQPAFQRVLPHVETLTQAPSLNGPDTTDGTNVPEQPNASQPKLRSQQLFVPAELTPWSVVGAKAQVLPAPAEQKEARILTLDGQGHHEVRIPGPFKLAFNQLALRVETEQDIIMRVRYLLKGSPVLGTVGNINLPASSDLQTAVFDLPHVRRLGLGFDEIMIEAVGVQGPWSLHSVEGFVRPLADFLPREVPQLVAAGNQARRAVGLSTAADRVIEVQILANSRLDFSYTWPDHLRSAQQRELTLRVLVESPGEEFPNHTLIELDLLAQRADVPWRSVSADLNTWGGSQAQLRFQLQADQDSLLALGEPLLSVAQAQAPTVLMVTSDTHRADHVQLGREPDDSAKVLTPNLAQLARRGVSFSNCFASANITVPSHVALLTATHPRDTGVLTNVALLGEEARTLAECFRERGYVTYAATSLRFLGLPGSNLAQGFDRLLWPVRDESSAAETLAEVQRWLPETEGRPLFLWVHLFDAHYPYEPPAEFGELYYLGDPKSEALPEPDFPVPASFAGIRDVEWFRAQYRGEISYVDAELGKLLDQPRIQAGWVAVTSDHGESLGAHGIYWDHSGLYPDTIHVPMVLAGPGLSKTLSGSVLSEPVRQMDLGRTLLDWSGQSTTEFPGHAFPLPTDSRIDSQTSSPGKSEARSTDRPRFALSNHGFSASVTVERYHLILYLDNTFRNRFDHQDRPFQRHAVELYDLQQDPGSVHNLAREELAKTKALRAILVDWLLARQTTGWGKSVGASSEMQKQLAELGYLETHTGPANDAPLFNVDCSCELCLPYQE